jgi:hypothetical protein
MNDDDTNKNDGDIAARPFLACFKLGERHRLKLGTT